MRAYIVIALIAVGFGILVGNAIAPMYGVGAAMIITGVLLAFLNLFNGWGR